MLTKEKSSDVIEKLNVNEEIKGLLRNIDKVAGSSNERVKRSVKCLFIESPSCNELLDIAHAYERIIFDNGVYLARGSKTFLSLAFPNSDDPSEFKSFYASPLIASATQNVYTGVFLISFEQYENGASLVRSWRFKELMDYVEQNKSHISFIFHVNNHMSEIDVFRDALKRHVNMVCTSFTHPDPDVASTYVMHQLSKAGFVLEEGVDEKIHELIESKIDFKSKDYDGYRSLEMLTNNLQYELTVSSKRSSENIISASDVKKIQSRIETISYESDSKPLIGFRMGGIG
ncbi:MAG: hypothetical protein J6O61_12045 [Butyrivibrio sp.]|uniref:hypothetical protein n=1 Tax=Butyrivibrio sp. TaxID=28121 RepID=UPI001B117729|nr:hypothetical protein [Butyrivibrio sp.]MBO6241548.1 hypothetical protein [Butyrivibrio sp.]